MIEIKKIWYLIIGKEYKDKVPPYPNDFAIIDFSPISKQNGIRTNQNKIIYRYLFDINGNRIIRKYRFSKARVKALLEVSKIPIMDKTQQKEILPIFSKVLPSEVEYTV